MINIFDYIFYRSYLQYKKAGEPGTASGSLYIAAVLIALLPILYVEIPRLIVGEVYNAKYLITFIFIICTYIRYKRKEKEILRRYEHSKLNKKIPNWLIWMALPVSAVIGIALMILVDVHIVERYHLEGIIGRWFCDTFL